MADKQPQPEPERLEPEMNVIRFLSEAVAYVAGHRRELELEAHNAKEKREALVRLGKELGVTLPGLPPSREEQMLQTLSEAEAIVITVKKGTSAIKIIVDGTGARFDAQAQAQAQAQAPTHTKPKQRATRGAVPEALMGTRIRVRDEPHSETTASAAIEEYGSLARWLASVKGWTAANIYSGYIEYLADGEWRQFTR